MTQSGVVSSELIQLDIEPIDLDAPSIEPGVNVEVRRRFDHAWARGFEILELTEAGYRLRRQSDGSILPVAFPLTDVRRG
jgi:integrase